jgi:hypothetical protein
MDEERMDELAGDPRFIPGVFNYCDRWCERCPFTARCLNYAMGQEMEFGYLAARDAENEAFWDKLHETLESTREMIEDEAEETDFDLDEEELQQSIREQEEVHDAAQAQPYSQTAMRYIDIVDGWLKSNEGLVGDKSDESKSSLPADLPSVGPGDAASMRDCLEVILWYQRQIYVKLCRAASGTIRAEGDELDYMQEDADGSAKVALIGIERSMGAWATLLGRFPDHEDILFALGTLKRLLRQVEAAFPNARSFRRPGFDTDSPL